MADFEQKSIAEINITTEDLRLALDNVLERKDLRCGADSVEYFLPGSAAVSPEQRSYNAVSRLETDEGEAAYLWEMTAPGIGFGKLLFFKDDERVHCLEGDPEELKVGVSLMQPTQIGRLPILNKDGMRKIYDEVSNEELQSRQLLIEQHHQERHAPRRGAGRLLSLLLQRIGPPV